MVYSGLLFHLPEDQRLAEPDARDSRWPSFCETLLQSCRQVDFRVLDTHSLLLLFSDADTKAAEAKGRIMARALDSWRRTNPAIELLDYVTIDEVKLAPKRILVPGISRERPATSSGSNAAARSIMKRLIDLVGTVVAAILASPLMVLIAFGIRVSSEGPILFLQKRVGENGKMFTMVKFRTMQHRADPDAHRSYMKSLIAGEIPVEHTETPVKVPEDARIYPFGALLRRWSLDELPQLFNVLNGTMSLVGPRPSVYYELEDYQDWHRERLTVKPGITGQWQVYGRGRTSFDDMVRMDIRYIRNWSIQQDLKLLALTIPAAFGRVGAQ